MPVLKVALGLGLTVVMVGCVELLLLMFLLPSRGDSSKPEAVNFSTDPRILRGVWEGVVTDISKRPPQVTPVKLELTATYVSETQYTVSGSLKLGDGPAEPLTGTAFGATRLKFSQPQMSPPLPPMLFWATTMNGDTPLRAVCLSSLYTRHDRNGPWVYEGLVLEPGTVRVESERCPYYGSISIQIERVP